ncbi:hypothetical protein F7725_022138 [Dissostichus mawsoni]|uniref:Rho-GAP domain-containing protein n=1 Tax=Dissostichus mawsoni TaxID=36200 RepID=A0A7J5ZFF1_DISMA|nr:hypothetical protein F7725_022138 [Dissostichus mawsoni]
MNYEQLIIPADVLRHDEKLRLAQKGGPAPSVKTPPPRPPLPTQQFGVSLQYLREKNMEAIIPLVMSQSVTYLKDKGLNTEGIFRRSARVQIIKDVQKLYNLGGCRQLMEDLPEHNFIVAKYLLSFLHAILIQHFPSVFGSRCPPAQITP